MTLSRRALARRLTALLIALAAMSCAGPGSRPVRELYKDPAELLTAACRPGHDIVAAQGSVWLKARSKEASGQFPANVKASPGSLDLEVTNLLGGSEARIQVRGRKYEIQNGSRVQKGAESWGGIPLRWSDELFLGRIPCPDAAQLKGAKLAIGDKGELTVETPASLAYEEEKFTYRFRSWAGSPWAESLDWERHGTAPISVHFAFDQPEDKTASPLKWEATSEQGEVKIRWKDHQFTPRSSAGEPKVN